MLRTEVKHSFGPVSEANESPYSGGPECGVKDPAQAEGHDLYKFLEKIIAKLCAALYAANAASNADNAVIAERKCVDFGVST